MDMKRGQFAADDLKKVEGDFVVLASGGPLLNLECVEGDNAVVSWKDSTGKTIREMIPCVCLRRLVPLAEPCCGGET